MPALSKQTTRILVLLSGAPYYLRTVYYRAVSNDILSYTILYTIMLTRHVIRTECDKVYIIVLHALACTIGWVLPGITSPSWATSLYLCIPRYDVANGLLYKEHLSVVSFCMQWSTSTRAMSAPAQFSLMGCTRYEVVFLLHLHCIIYLRLYDPICCYGRTVYSSAVLSYHVPCHVSAASCML